MIERKGFWRELSIEATRMAPQTSATNWLSRTYTLFLMFGAEPIFFWASFKSLERFHWSTPVIATIGCFLVGLATINTKCMIDSLRQHGIRNNGSLLWIIMLAGLSATRNLRPDPTDTAWMHA